MADILYQPGVPGGGTLTTQIPGAPQMPGGPGMPHMGFDLDWLKQLAARKAQQENDDRNFARQMMMKQMPRPEQRQVTRTPSMRRPEEDGDSRELWVNGQTGQPSQPWLPGAMRVGVNQRLGAGSQGGSASISGGSDDFSAAPDRWDAAEARKRPEMDMNPGRGGAYTQATGRGGW